MPILTGQKSNQSQLGDGLAPGSKTFGISEQTFGPDQEAIAKTQADAAKYPSTLRDQHFKMLFPMLSGAFGGLGPAGMATAGGGPVGTQPTISAGPVWNPQQVQQQVNASHASTDAETATHQNEAAASAGARGFSSQSPLVAALQGQMASAGMGQKADAERGIRWDAAAGNAKQTLTGQQAREGQYASRQSEDIERRKPYFAMQNALLSALGGLI